MSATVTRRGFLGLGAVGVLALPVAGAIIAYPKKSKACTGPVIGGDIQNTPPAIKSTKTAKVRVPEGFGRGGGDHGKY